MSERETTDLLVPAVIAALAAAIWLVPIALGLLALALARTG